LWRNGFFGKGQKMGNVRRNLFWLVVSAALLCGAAGCTLEQLERADRAAADANAVGEAITQISTGPAAAIIPPELLQVLLLLGVGLETAVVIWQKIRAAKMLEKNQDLSVTIKAVADAIDQAAPQAAADVKAQVLAVMMQRRIYDRADRVVDANRTKKTV
jgi:hypothetical protein